MSSDDVTSALHHIYQAAIAHHPSQPSTTGAMPASRALTDAPRPSGPSPHSICSMDTYDQTSEGSPSNLSPFHSNTVTPKCLESIHTHRHFAVVPTESSSVVPARAPEHQRGSPSGDMHRQVSRKSTIEDCARGGDGSELSRGDMVKSRVEVARERGGSVGGAGVAVGLPSTAEPLVCPDACTMEDSQVTVSAVTADILQGSAGAEEERESLVGVPVNGEGVTNRASDDGNVNGSDSESGSSSGKSDAGDSSSSSGSGSSSSGSESDSGSDSDSESEDEHEKVSPHTAHDTATSGAPPASAADAPTSALTVAGVAAGADEKEADNDSDSSSGSSSDGFSSDSSSSSGSSSSGSSSSDSDSESDSSDSDSTDSEDENTIPALPAVPLLTPLSLPRTSTTTAAAEVTTFPLKRSRPEGEGEDTGNILNTKKAAEDSSSDSDTGAEAGPTTEEALMVSHSPGAHKLPARFPMTNDVCSRCY